jgi:hypothetical protein
MCDAILLKDIAIQNFDDNMVLSAYDPQDKVSLFSLFCEILVKVPSIFSYIQ